MKIRDEHKDVGNSANKAQLDHEFIFDFSVLYGEG